MMPALPIEGYDTTREDGVTRIRPVYAAPLPVEAVSVQGQGLLPQETPALPVELPVAQPSGILAEADRALSGAVRAPFDALDERLFGKSGKKGTYREAIQKFFKTGPSDEVKTGVNRLLGTGGEERYKTWPEKLVVDAITAPGNVLKSETPVSTEELIKPALDVSNLAGTGGLAGVSGGAVLGSGPVRRAATLPMDEASRMARAAEQGYTIDAFHGTTSPIDELLPRRAARNEQMRIEGVHVAEKPSLANRYAEGNGGNVLPVKVNPGQSLDASALVVEGTPEAALYENLLKGTGRKPMWMAGAEVGSPRVAPPLSYAIDAVPIKKAERLIKQAGYDSVKYDAKYGSLVPGGMNVVDKSPSYVVLNPANIRSRFAKFDPKNVGKNGLLLSDNQPSLAIGAVSKSEKPFYSALERSLGSINQNKASGEQWLGMLANKGGVKPDELQWSGIGEFLAGKPSVTKAEIDSFLKDNAFGVQEVVKGGAPKKLDQLDKSERLQLINEFREREGLPSNEIPTRQELQQFLNDKSGNANAKATRYHDYQLPGGTNYREVLMTLPKSEAGLTAKPDGNKGAWNVYDRSGNKIAENLNPAMSEKEAISFSTRHNNNQYKSSHWDEPNILAHMRMNDRTIDGKKSLHLEEIQSDWHQAGRKQGYKQDNKNKLSVKNEGGIWRVRDEKGERVDLDGSVGFVTEELARAAIARNTRDIGGVPDAPFKKNWHELALKRAIREAAENGYERLSWTPGEAQAARYDLSKQLKELQYLKHDDGKYELAGITVKGDGFNHPEKITADKLPDIVGKEIAEKIIKNEGKRARGHPSNGGYFEGIDLKVGGEGMKGFYDNIVPKTIEKLGKQFGVKVQVGKSGKDTIYYIDIPPAMRDKVLAEGFPLFSANVPVIDNDQTR